MKRRDVSKIVLLDDVGCGTIRVVMILFGNILQVLERAAVVVIGFASFIVSDTVMVQTDSHHTIVMMMRNRCVRKHTELRQNDHPQSETGLHRLGTGDRPRMNRGQTPFIKYFLGEIYCL